MKTSVFIFISVLLVMFCAARPVYAQKEKAACAGASCTLCGPAGDWDEAPRCVPIPRAALSTQPSRDARPVNVHVTRDWPHLTAVERKQIMQRRNDLRTIPTYPVVRWLPTQYQAPAPILNLPALRPREHGYSCTPNFGQCRVYPARLPVPAMQLVPAAAGVCPAGSHSVLFARPGQARWRVGIVCQRML